MTKPPTNLDDNRLTVTLLAAERAAKWHSKDRHKGANREPYVNHLIEVAHLVTEATGGSDGILTSAAFLHDAVEKAGVQPSQIRNEFGDAIFELVMEVTDGQSISKEERRRRQIDTASEKSMRAKLLKLADLTSNLRALAEYDSSGRETENPFDYAIAAEKVASGLRGVSPWLEEQFEHALSAVLARARQLPGKQETPVVR
jgi:(p)ppGpp synthase/HD superfamily hydrolase